MKRFIGIVGLIAVLVYFSAGTVCAEPGMPDMEGKWVAKTYAHHHEKQGFFANENPDSLWIVEEQQGRFFTGERVYVKRQITDKETTESFSGVISRDGKRIYIVDHDGDILGSVIFSV